MVSSLHSFTFLSFFFSLFLPFSILLSCPVFSSLLLSSHLLYSSLSFSFHLISSLDLFSSFLPFSLVLCIFFCPILPSLFLSSNFHIYQIWFECPKNHKKHLLVSITNTVIGPLFSDQNKSSLSCQTFTCKEISSSSSTPEGIIQLKLDKSIELHNCFCIMLLFIYL